MIVFVITTEKRLLAARCTDSGDTEEVKSRSRGGGLPYH